MTETRTELARIGIRTALSARKDANVSLSAPLSIFDFVEKFKVEAWFVGGSSFSGMFAKGMNRVFVPSERPAGRKVFTCAHEFGHWKFNHGNVVESLEFDKPDHEVPEEYLANIFAAHLLMPRRAVDNEFALRQTRPSEASHFVFYSVACQLNVGYETLLRHMCWSLRMISRAKMDDLLRISPKQIRNQLLGFEQHTRLVLVNETWHTVPIDMEIGDLAIIPKSSDFDNSSLDVIGDSSIGLIVSAKRTGISQIGSQIANGWSSMLRICRKTFVGRGKYRHLEDPDEYE